MFFTSLPFLIFLPIVFLLYWFVFTKVKSQNLFIVAASYFFYGWLDWRFLILIFITTFSTFWSGVLYEKFNNNFKLKKAISTFNIVLNLLILCVFKYYNFFTENLQLLFEGIGIHFDLTTLYLILPIGISFYTFQAIGYTIDIYSNKIKATNDGVAFFAYMSFFPQLTSGPISKAPEYFPQFLQKRNFDYNLAVDGMRQILWGLFKKMVVAESCATLVNPIFSDITNQSGSTLLLGAIYYTFQIYCDFSGYSDMAIGIGKLFGIKLMNNFNLPYFSRDITEFWRRWHISLTSWFRDYIYIPLGGNRVSKMIRIRNTIIIFLISGLWHGANWTFICWGAYHAILFIPHLIFNVKGKQEHSHELVRSLSIIKEVWKVLKTFFLVCIGWIIFRADNIKEAFIYIKGIFSASLFSFPQVVGYKALFFILLLLIVEWLQRKEIHTLNISKIKYPMVRVLIYLIIFFTIMEYGGNQSAFIYFKF